jgi:cell division protease FtsH
MTTGAGNDLERATELARKMVCEWGMSPKMGPLTFGKREEAIFLGKEFSRHQDYSEATAEQIDEEIHRFVTEAFDCASKILAQHRDSLESITEALLEHEVLDGEEIYAIINTHSGIDARRTKSTEKTSQEVETEA